MDVPAVALCAASTLAGLVLLGLDGAWPRLTPLYRRVSAGAVAILIVGSSAALVALAIDSARGEREWDFLAFWVPAVVAFEGGDFYQPDALRQVDLPFAVSTEFEQEVLDGGFSYPPSTMLLVAPFGAAPFRTAFGLWYLLQFAGLALALLLLARWLGQLRQSTEGDDRPPLLAALAIVALPTVLTVTNAQTNFWVLVCCLVVINIYDGDRFTRGVALAIGVLLKPFVAILFLPAVVYQQWKTLVAGSLVLIAAALLSLQIWGQEVFQRYVERVGRFPDYLYGDAQPTNQSWAAFGTRNLWGGQDPLAEPLFWLGVALFFGVAAALVVRQRFLERRPSTALWLLILLTGLVIYPATLKHYFVLLVLPCVFLWRRGERFGLNMPLQLILLGSVFLLTSAARGNWSFTALALLWAIYLYLTPLDSPPEAISRS